MKQPSSSHTRAVALLLIVGLSLSLGGCAWLAYGLAGGKREVHVEARYRGLDNQRVAVLVMADSYMLHQHPQSIAIVTRAVSNELARKVPGVVVTDPQVMNDFQHNSPHSATEPFSRLVTRLNTNRINVDRIVMIDLSEYRTHEPGNRHLWMGAVSGKVFVIDVRGNSPDVPVFEEDITAIFPEDRNVGVPEHGSDARSIQGGMVANFARNVVWLFYDHKEVR